MGPTKMTDGFKVDLVKDSIFLTTSEIAEKYAITQRYVNMILQDKSELRKEMLDAYTDYSIQSLREGDFE